MSTTTATAPSTAVHTPTVALRGGSSVPVEIWDYSGGEVGVRLGLPADDRACVGATADVTWRVQSSRDLMGLVMAHEVLARRGVRCGTLVMPYMPYARQSRVTEANSSFTLKAFAKLVNALGFERVICLDPHDDVTPALIENIRPVFLPQIVGSFEELRREAAGGGVVAPDAGASKKAHAGAEALGVREVVQCLKHRDEATGKLDATLVVAATVPDKVLILDDICDGGATFLRLAKSLREKGAKRVSLYVTHGIFSKGLSVFDGVIDHVYTTDSFKSPPLAANGADPRVTVLPIARVVDRAS